LFNGEDSCGERGDASGLEDTTRLEAFLGAGDLDADARGVEFGREMGEEVGDAYRKEIMSILLFGDERGWDTNVERFL